MEYTKEEFEEIVAQDVRATNKITPEQAAWLRSPEVVDDWYDALVALGRSVDLQMTAKRVENATKAKELMGFPQEWQEHLERIGTWRINAMRFKSAIEDRIAEARKLRRTSVPKDMVDAQGIERLYKAIEHHRDRIFNEDDENIDDTEADEELWAVLKDEKVQELGRLLGAA